MDENCSLNLNINKTIMKINLTKKQYRALLDLVYMGSWMVNAYKEEDYNKEHEKLENHIFSFAKDFGFENFADEKNFPTMDFDNSIQSKIDEYNDEVFWDELINGLCNRDLLNKYGSEKLSKMDWEERFDKKLEFEKKWEKEFEKNGIDRMGVVKGKKK